MDSKKTLWNVTLVLCCAGLALFSGCGAVTIPPNVIVTISPASASVVVNQTQQFTATVQNDPLNKGVNWQVFGSGDTLCTPATCGTIDQNGKYTAPSGVPTNPDLLLMSVAATSISNSTARSNFAILTILPPPAVAVKISPTTTAVQAGRTTQFTATVQNDPSNKGVTWSISTLSGLPCSGSDCGSIDSTGNYTGPEILPNASTIIVTARSQADTSVSSKATVNLGSDADNAKLVGRYAFLLNGVNIDGVFSMAGSVTADGNGRITSGIGDLNLSGSSSAELSAPFVGTYSVGPDNRGSITLTASLPSGLFTQSFSFALNSFVSGVAGRGRVAENVGDQFWSSGVLAKQDPTAFSSEAIAGSWVFNLNGADISGTTLASIGKFTFASGSLTAGQTDVLASARVLTGPKAMLTRTYAPNLSFVGGYSVDASGRGVAAFNFTGENPGFSNFSFYVISSGELFIIQTDGCADTTVCGSNRGMSGTAVQQSSTPVSTTSPTRFAASGKQ